MRSFREYPQPFPEVRIGPWKMRKASVHESRTDMERKQMFVPDEDSPVAQWYRDHEVAHAIFTPKAGLEELSDRHSITPQALDAAENMRLNFMLAKKGLGQGCKPLTDAGLTEGIRHHMRSMKEMGKSDPTYSEEADQESFLTACSALYTKDVDFGVNLIEEVIEDREVIDFLFQTIRSAHCVLDRARLRAQRRGSPDISFRATVEVAKMIQHALNTMSTLRMAGCKKPDYVDGGSNLWGKMSTEKVAMQTPAKWRHRFSKIRRSDSGVKMTAIHRLLTDQKIFSYKIRKKGGTVLIDCSGSMSLSPDQIYEIVMAAPAATIALYSGDGGKGVLRIVAEDGKLADPRHIHPPGGGGNTVDGPALRWLATKAMPRVWVSDGQVTGIGDASDGMLYAEAQMIKRMHQITQVPSGEKALEVFTKGGL